MGDAFKRVKATLPFLNGSSTPFHTKRNAFTFAVEPSWLPLVHSRFYPPFHTAAFTIGIVPSTGRACATVEPRALSLLLPPVMVADNVRVRAQLNLSAHSVANR